MGGAAVEVLSAGEVRALATAEATIEAGLGTFVEVGQALCEVRDRRLYRAEFATFEAYCRERWGMSKTHANRLVDAAEVVEALTPMGVTPTPTTERQARALVPLKDQPDRMAEAMRTAADRTGGKPTAAAITEAVDNVIRIDRGAVADEVNKIVDQEKARRADLAELRAWEAANQPPGFDPERNAEMVRQRGALNRLCRDLAGFDDPAEFVAAHIADNATDRLQAIAENADAARAWLDGFLTEMEQHR